MNHPLAKLSAALSLGAIDAFPLAVWRRLSGAFLLLALFGMGASAQTVIQTPNWSNILDNSRAINWSSAGFTIPNYTVNCVTQPSLAAGSSAAPTRFGLQAQRARCPHPQVLPFVVIMVHRVVLAERIRQITLCGDDCRPLR